MKKRKLNKQLPQILTMQCKDKTLKNIRYKKKTLAQQIIAGFIF